MKKKERVKQVTDEKKKVTKTLDNDLFFSRKFAQK